MMKCPSDMLRYMQKHACLRAERKEEDELSVIGIAGVLKPT